MEPIYKADGSVMKAYRRMRSPLTGVAYGASKGVFCRGSGGVMSPVFIGEGLRVYEGLVREAFPSAVIAPESEWQVRASNIAELALLDAGSDDDNETPVNGKMPSLLPVYRRKSEAEFKRLSS